MHENETGPLYLHFNFRRVSMTSTEMGRRPRKLILAVCVLLLSGCASYQLQMSPSLAAVDESAVSPKLSQKKYTRLMVIPPSGTSRGQFDHQIALFEREFLKNGTTIISGAITGRVVAESENSLGKEGRTGRVIDLSDAERALVMAKDTGADAILQIGAWQFSDAVASRYFILDSDKGDRFVEVQLAEYRSWTKEKFLFPSRILHFVGKLIDVSSAEVVASFKLKDAVNWNLPSEYRASISYRKCNPHPQYPDPRNTRIVLDNIYDKNKCPQFEDENFKYEDPSWLPEAEEKLQAIVIQHVAKTIASQQEHKP